MRRDISLASDVRVGIRMKGSFGRAHLLADLRIRGQDHSNLEY